MIAVEVTGATLRSADGAATDRVAWEERAARVRDAAATDGIAASEVADALRSFELADDAGRRWTYDGEGWVALDGGNAADGPRGRLTLRPFSFQLVPEAPAESVAGIRPTALDAFDDPELEGLEENLQEPPATVYRPTHVVPGSGLPTWPRPDPSLAPDNQLDPGLDVMVLEWRDDGWAYIETSNTWTAWIDGRLLEPLPESGPPG